MSEHSVSETDNHSSVSERLLALAIPHLSGSALNMILQSFVSHHEDEPTKIALLHDILIRLEKWNDAKELQVRHYASFVLAGVAMEEPAELLSRFGEFDLETRGFRGVLSREIAKLDALKPEPEHPQSD